MRDPMVPAPRTATLRMRSGMRGTTPVYRRRNAEILPTISWVARIVEEGGIMGFGWPDGVWQDFRYGARQLRLNPAVTTVAVLSLALGIGANTAIFQLVDAVRLRTLPVANPQELAVIDFAKGSMRSGWFSSLSSRLTYAQWVEIQKQQRGFSGVVAWSVARFNLSPGGEARYADGLYVNGDFFRVVGVQPLLGRGFTAGDDRI